jgi:fructokinase
MSVFGSVEAGGTKFVCGIGTGPADLDTVQFPTTSPDETVEKAIAFFQERGKRLRSIGIGSFGPIDPRPDSPGFGHITSTPKLEWRNYDLAGALREKLGIPVGFDTDVNAAVLAESRWGAGAGLEDFLYVTVGTGVGGGAMVHGRVLHGLLHPEMGHIPVPHDSLNDPFAGCCPYHGDCLEGLASGPAMEARWGIPPSALPVDHPAWALEANYLALALAAWVCTLSPRRVLLGGGVMQQSHLLPLIRAELARILNGYIQASELLSGLDRFVTRPQLGSRAGVLGGLILAEEILEAQPSSRS